MVQNVNKQHHGVRYGILIYDIPKENTKLYERIQAKIRQKAIRLNLSVYLCLWGMRDEIEKIIEEAQEETKQYATVFFAKFDDAEEEHIRRAAKESLIVEVKRVAKRLTDSVRKAREKAEAEGKEFKHISEGYAWKIRKRLEEAEALAMLFGLTRDIKYAMESTQRMFAAELEKIAQEKEKKKAEKKAAREAKKKKKKEEKKRERKQKREAKKKKLKDFITGASEKKEPEKTEEEEGASPVMDDDIDTEEIEKDSTVETSNPEQPPETSPSSWTDPV